jgi:hypothetical protein
MWYVLGAKAILATAAVWLKGLNKAALKSRLLLAGGMQREKFRPAASPSNQARRVRNRKADFGRR